MPRPSRPLILSTLVALFLSVGCAAPVPRDQIGTIDDWTLLKQMQWRDWSVPANFDFGEGGRDGYIARVRDEILARHPEWPPDVVEAVGAHRVEIGMTSGQVVAAIGWPREYPEMLWAFAPGTNAPWTNDVDVLIARARANQWSYEAGADNLLVFFVDGAVDRMIDNRSPNDPPSFPTSAVR